MPGSWTEFNIPNTSTGAFSADLMILLTDGSVLCHNGYASLGLGPANQWLRLTPDQHGKYETGSWSAEIDMQFARQWFGSGVLRDGRVFVIGGEDCSDPLNPTDAPTGEIFDPQTNLFSPINKPASVDYIRGDCNGTVLEDGRVLLGAPNSTAFPLSHRTAIWDPHSDTWVEAGLEFGAVGTNTKKDPFMEETFTLLRDGSVLAPAVQDTPKAQRYVPALDQWVQAKVAPVDLAITVLSGTTVMETGPTIVLPDGGAFCIGGTGKTATFKLGPHLKSPGSWTKGPDFPPDTSGAPNWPLLTALDAPACLLPSGKVVLMGGTTTPIPGDYFSLNPILLEYDPNSGAAVLPPLDVQPALPAGNFTWQSMFLLLPTGQILLSAQTNTLFLYTPDPAAGQPHQSWRPAHIEVPSPLEPGHSYPLAGTQINGLSQAVCYGDDGGMATNYPIVRLTNPAGKVFYLRSHHFSTMGIATGHHDRKHCTIDIPSGLATGKYELVVIANGIPSERIWVQIGFEEHEHEHRFEGKVESLIYDGFGDFEAFIVKNSSLETRRFESREHHIAELTNRAWEERTHVLVISARDHPHHVGSIALLV